MFFFSLNAFMAIGSDVFKPSNHISTGIADREHDYCKCFLVAKVRSRPVLLQSPRSGFGNEASQKD